MIDSYQLNIYAGNNTPPIAVHSIPAAQVLTGVTPPPPTSTTNPAYLVWEDPDNNDKVAQWFDNGPLKALPKGKYEATLQAFNSAGGGAESNRAPFDVLPVPVAVKGLRAGR